MRTLMKSAEAISLFERPSAASLATRSSVSVSPSEAGRRPLIRLSSARALSAHRRAPSSSKTASACSSASRAARFCFACLSAEPRQSSVRPRSNGYGCSSSSARARRVGCERAVEVALGGGEQAATARGGRHGPRATETLRVQLVRLEVGARLLELAESDQRLDRVRPDRVRRVVRPPPRSRPGGRADSRRPPRGCRARARDGRARRG